MTLSGEKHAPSSAVVNIRSPIAAETKASVSRNSSYRRAFERTGFSRMAKTNFFKEEKAARKARAKPARSARANANRRRHSNSPWSNLVSIIRSKAQRKYAGFEPIRKIECFWSMIDGNVLRQQDPAGRDIGRKSRHIPPKYCIWEFRIAHLASV